MTCVTFYVVWVWWQKLIVRGETSEVICQEDLCSSILQRDLSNLFCDIDTVWDLWPLLEHKACARSTSRHRLTFTSALHLHLRHLADTFKKETIHTFCVISDAQWGLSCYNIFNLTRGASYCQETFPIDSVLFVAASVSTADPPKEQENMPHDSTVLIRVTFIKFKRLEQ